MDSYELPHTYHSFLEPNFQKVLMDVMREGFTAAEIIHEYPHIATGLLFELWRFSDEEQIYEVGEDMGYTLLNDDSFVDTMSEAVIVAQVTYKMVDTLVEQFVLETSETLIRGEEGVPIGPLDEYSNSMIELFHGNVMDAGNLRTSLVAGAYPVETPYERRN